MGGKINKYLKILYPEYDTLTQTKKEELQEKINFIAEHVEEIESEFDRINSENGGQDFSEHDIIKSILEGMQNEYLTTQQIGKRTINASIKDKKNAEQVEKRENNTITKEGEDLSGN